MFSEKEKQKKIHRRLSHSNVHCKKRISQREGRKKNLLLRMYCKNAIFKESEKVFFLSWHEDEGGGGCIIIVEKESYWLLCIGRRENFWNWSKGNVRWLYSYFLSGIFLCSIWNALTSRQAWLNVVYMVCKRVASMTRLVENENTPMYWWWKWKHTFSESSRSSWPK